MMNQFFWLTFIQMLLVQTNAYYIVNTQMHYLQLVLCQSSTIKLIEHQVFYDPARPTTSLLKELTQTKELQTVQQYFSIRHAEPQELRLLGLLTTLIMHHQGIEQFVEQCLGQRQKSSKTQNWIFKDVICPYRNVLFQCCYTPQLFKAIKNQHFDNSIFLKRLPYLIRLIQSVLKISENIIRIGRYLLAGRDAKTYIFFVECYMVFLGSLYRYLRVSLQNYLHWITKKRVEINKIKEILEWVLLEALPQINEKIMVLNSNKYFDFQSKNIKVQLFESEKQSTAVQKLIKEIQNNISQENCLSLENDTLLQTKIHINDQMNDNFSDKIPSRKSSSYSSDEGQMTICELKMTLSTMTAASDSL